jgi:N-hydroxyarylamine O-acetyltransferase
MTFAVKADTVSPAWVQRYLAVLGAVKQPPSLVALSALTRAHIDTIAFENITSLLRRAARSDGPVPPVDPEELLSNWEQRRGGGVCFEIASMFERLLRALGYRSTLILGQVMFPGAHQAVLVELDEGRYLVDVGCGAPLFAPIPLHGEVQVHHAGLGYRFRPGDEDETWHQDRFVDEMWTPLFRYDVKPAVEQVREEGYQRHHVPGESWVIDGPRLVRCTDHAVFSLRGDELTVYRAGGKQRERISDPADYVRLATEVFRLPELPIEEAIKSWLKKNYADEAAD